VLTVSLNVKNLQTLLSLFITICCCLSVQAAESNQVKNLQVGVNLQVRAYLQGPYDTNTGLMKDTLRSLGLLPQQQPYTKSPFLYSGTETLNRSLTGISIGGDADALVDWALLELRDAANPAVVIAQKAVGVQADSDLMDVETGSNTLAFLKVSPANYHVALRHRNHLSVVTATAQALSFTTSLIDFSNTTLTVAGQNSRVINKGKALLWAGDANQDKKVIINGVGSDTTVLLSNILGAAANTGFNSSYRLNGYAATDLNLDGYTVATGPNNDANVGFSNVLAYPANTVFASNYILSGNGY
jgi:hypothetical protein